VNTPTDKNQLGLSEQAYEQLGELVERGGFRERQDAYRLAVSLALAEMLPPTAEGVSRTTYLNVGSLDPDGSLRAAVQSIRADHGGRPYALVERLAEAGIARLHDHLYARKSLRELLLAYQEAPEPSAP
jgi:hypothetical protein